MDEVKLAQDIIRWRELTQELSGLEYSIKEAVMAKKKTVAIAGVVARYYKGRTTYEYKKAVLDAFSPGPDSPLGDPIIRDLVLQAIIAAKDTIQFDTLPAVAYSNIAKVTGLEVESHDAPPSVKIVLDGPNGPGDDD